MQNYLESELFHGVGVNPARVNIESKDFEVIEAPSKITRRI